MIRTKTDWELKHKLNMEFDENVNISVYNQEKEKCFHYTSLDVFWKIIDTELMRATNIKFSNDSEEYNAGKRLVESFKNIGKIPDFSQSYMICFCENGNLLSQWREYAKQGVCIEFDFNYDNNFKILKKDSIETGMVVYCVPIKVLYAKYNLQKNYNKIDDDYLKSIKLYNSSFTKKATNLSFYNIKESINETVKKLHSVAPEFNKTELGKTLIPYIKHYDFNEEKEKRMVFTFENFENKDYILFDQYNDKKIRKPYINVKCKKEDDNLECSHIYIGKNINFELYKYIKNCSVDYSRKGHDYINIVKREGTDIYISEGKNQKELYGEVKQWINDFEETINEKLPIKVWCHGHWPIRSVTIAPSLNQEIIKESIEMYKQNIYWLTDVEIKTSSTPYREKR